MNDPRLRTYFFNALILALSVSPQLLIAQRRGEQPAPPPPVFTCNTNGPRLSLGDLIGLLEKIVEKTMTPACIESKIDKQGVNFERIPIVDQVLTEFGASDVIKGKIRFPPPPPPPPSPKVAGALTVNCSVPECEVFIGGVHQTTRSGQSVIRGLSPGKLPLVVYREGFLPNSDDIDLLENQAKSVTISLRPIPPDPTIPALKVKELLWDMTAATGRIESVNGNGELLWITDDKPLEWKIPKFSKTLVNDLDITFKNTAGRDCKLKITGDTAKPKSCNNFKKEPKTDVVAAAQLFLKYQIHDILGILSRREFVRIEGRPNTL